MVSCVFVFYFIVLYTYAGIWHENHTYTGIVVYSNASWGIRVGKNLFASFCGFKGKCE